MKDIFSDGSKPRPSLGSAQARPFFRDRAQTFEKDPGSGSIFWEGPRKLGLLLLKNRGPSQNMLVVGSLKGN